VSKIGLIVRREFLTRVRKPSFLIMTVLGPLLVAGGLALVIYLSMQETDIHHVLVVDRPSILHYKLKDHDKVLFSYDHAEWSDSAFKASPYTVMIDVPEDVLTDNVVQIFYKDLPSLSVQNIMSSEIERVLEQEKLRVNGVDPVTYARINTALKLQLFDIADSGKRSRDQEKAGIGFFFGYLIFLFIFLYGVQVMRGVMEEKQNRIVEVLISSVKPFQLMMGKILGIAMVGLTQFLLWVLLSAGLVTAVSAYFLKDRFDPEQLAQQQMTAQVQEQIGAQLQTAVPAAEDKGTELMAALNDIPLVSTLSLFVFYFLAGYLLYSSLFAAIGAAVDSDTETQQFMLPISIPMMLGLFVAQTAVYNAEGPAVYWCSLIPFTSPVVMMVRVAIGDAHQHPEQLAMSMVLIVVTFVLTTWLAGRIYRTGILLYGKKVSWRELGKWLFYRG
jgi:ABC-2 type transport system permease protein